ncbi:hypothetical protein GIB67_041126 [Kingdonia uniflora]|uniref:RING-type domain-containing protein n=1 Tax=Kingdonia uniflora TaxID=39325 RepID=A0A7J7LKK8_9MAGN|nr:hypothetical protein GIB67_041126 [Kingdonia uniflora]
MVTRKLFLHTEPEAVPMNESALSRVSYSSASKFDVNMVIILAALLCALILALGLNTILRCALRCGRRVAFETPEETTARLAVKGLKKRVLCQIPVAVFESGVDVPASDCPICLGEFADGEKVRVLPNCNHEFHVRCIDPWLVSHSSCPTCRNSLLEKQSAIAPPEPDDAENVIQTMENASVVRGPS